MHPLVSIIIPAYNAEKYISETIQSALDQSWPNKEIIIVDDGSSDNSLPIARTYESESVKVFSVENGGAARARNIGFGHSRGAYIQYLDADDLMINEKIEMQMRRMLQQANSQTVVCAGQWLRFANSVTHNPVGGIGPGGAAEFDMDPLSWLLLKPYNLMTVHAWLSPRNLIEKAGPWNESMTLDDDGEFFTRVVGVASKVLFCKGALTYYRTTDESPTQSNFSLVTKSPDNSEKLKSAYKSLETYKNILGRFGQPGARAALGRNYLYMAFSSYLICDEVYLKCIYQREIPFFQRFIISKWIKGKFGFFTLFLGWRSMKKIALRFGRY